MKIRSTAATLILSIGLMGFAAPPFMDTSALAADSPTIQHEESAGILSKTSDSTLLLKPATGVAVDLQKLTITQNGKTEKLPTTGTDKNGSEINIRYARVKSGIEIRAVSAYTFFGVGKCLTGVGGGVIAGGTTGGLGGAAVGTVTLPLVGTVSGGAVGLIGGAVGGGLTGAAASCFD